MHGRELILERIGIHRQHHAIHILAFVGRDIVEFDFIKLRVDIIFETVDIGLCVVGGKTVGIINLVVSDIVARIDSVAAMYRFVDYGTDLMGYL